MRISQIGTGHGRALNHLLGMLVFILTIIVLVQQASLNSSSAKPDVTDTAPAISNQSATKGLPMDAQEIIQRLQLQPHSEGGFFKETYRSDVTVPAEALPEDYSASRNAGTAIYYLLAPGAFSAMHRLKSDEVYHFYAGDPVTMLQLHPDGTAEVITIGNNIAAGHQPQVVVPAGTWQGSFLNEGGRYALMGCTVSPGFDFEDFELAEQDELIGEYPQQEEMIRKLTKE